MDADVLNIKSEVVFDNRITSVRNIKLCPDNRSQTDYSDTISIKYFDQDSILHLHNSALYIKGKVKYEKTDATATVGNDVKLVNFWPAFLFKEISYHLHGTEIDSVRNPGQAGLMKNYASLSSSEIRAGQAAGLTSYFKTGFNVSSTDTVVDVVIPMKYLLGFFEDYTRVLSGRHELKLIRQDDDSNCFEVGVNIKKVKLEISNIEWHVPQLHLSPKEKLKYLKVMESGDTIQLAFRSWVMREEFLSTSKIFDTWSVFTSSELKKPRFAIVAGQIDRRNNFKKDASLFDHCNMKNIKLCLNMQNYPYEDMNIKFPDEISLIFNNYSNFQLEYYNGAKNSPFITMDQFKTDMPMYVISANRQKEGISSANVDVKIKYEAHDKFLANTILYALLLCDNVIEYNMLTGTVRKL